jgi:hypothetical protein
VQSIPTTCVSVHVLAGMVHVLDGAMVHCDIVHITYPFGYVLVDGGSAITNPTAM